MFDGSTIAGRAARIQEAATRRWLVKDELAFVLTHQDRIGWPLHTQVHPRCQSGTLLLYDSSVLPNFKNDGWKWQIRKDTGRVREDRAKLVVNRETTILGTYVHSSEVSTFHRRSYGLRDSSHHIVLVHYFDEANKKVSRAGDKSVSTVPDPVQPSSQASTIPSSDNSIQANLSDETVDSIMKNDFDMDLLHDTVGENSTCVSADQLLRQDSDDIRLSFNDMLDFQDVPYIPTPTDDTRESVSDPVVDISDFSPDWDFVHGGAKILVCLHASLPTKVTSENEPEVVVQFGNHSPVATERVSDTVLRCTAPRAKESGIVDLFVAQRDDNARLVRVSSIKSFSYRSLDQVSPPLPVGRKALYNEKFMDTDVDTPVQSTSPLKGSNMIKGTGKRSRYAITPTNIPESSTALDVSNLFSFGDSELDDRQCKIRIVERLSEFHNAITSSSPFANFVDEKASIDNTSDQQTPAFASSGEPTPLSSPTGAADDGTVDQLSDQELESLSDSLLEGVVQQLVAVAHSSDELLEELNSLDETGLSLLHYVCFYNYVRLVPLLLSHGAHVNQQSTQGQTALHLAAGCGHQQVVDVLLTSGADLFALDFDGCTPADRAEKSGQADMAKRLRMNVASDEEQVGGGRGMQATYTNENHETNRKFLMGAFSTMSLHDKCALTLSFSRDSSSRRKESVGEASSVGDASMHSPFVSPLRDDVVSNYESDAMDSDVKSAIADDEAHQSKLEGAMELMGPEERSSLEDEVKVLQHNVRLWLLRRNYKKMRETTRRLHEAAKSMETPLVKQPTELSERERAAVTVQAATRSMLARRSFLQAKNVTIKVQAATRGALCRKNFARMKTHALASLVIQRNVKEWWYKHPSAEKTKDQVM